MNKLSAGVKGLLIFFLVFLFCFVLWMVASFACMWWPESIACDLVEWVRELLAG